MSPIIVLPGLTHAALEHLKHTLRAKQRRQRRPEKAEAEGQAVSAEHTYVVTNLDLAAWLIETGFAYTMQDDGRRVVFEAAADGAVKRRQKRAAGRFKAKEKRYFSKQTIDRM